LPRREWSEPCPERAVGWRTCELVLVPMARLARESAMHPDLVGPVPHIELVC
jgi:hypothetical protein